MIATQLLEPLWRSDAEHGLDQVQHALQCAAVLAAAHPHDVELQVAGLLHDVGHGLAPGDDAGHGRVGRAHVEAALGARVGALVELHVPAKRWLVTVDPAYRATLSRGSRRTLVAQGAELDDAERAAFEADPHHLDAVVLRRADEAAKVSGLAVGDVAAWYPVIEAVAAAHR